MRGYIVQAVLTGYIESLETRQTPRQSWSKLLPLVIRAQQRVNKRNGCRCNRQQLKGFGHGDLQCCISRKRVTEYT